jgi:hypothetical protein
MKKIYVILGLTLLLMAAPMGEERALALFNSIKQSEYSWVVEQWDAEMHIKTQSRSSTRKSIWESDHNPRDIRENMALHNTANLQPQIVTEEPPPLLPPTNSTPSNSTPVVPPQEPVEPQEPVTVPAIK